MAVTLSLAVGDYDRTRAIFDGRAKIEGCDVTAVMLEPEEAFHRAFKFQEFDVTEMSLSSHIVNCARGSAHYVGIPAFVSRLFRHSGIYIRTDRGIKRPEDLKGKTIGLPEYQITANVWIRGILKDQHGVEPRDIKWRRGGIEEPGRDERTPIKLPADIVLKDIPRDRTLSQMLETGELDGMIGARAPSCFRRGAPNVARLYPDYPKAEEEYFRKTKMFPIMHLIGIRRTLVEQHPWLAVSVFKAFIKAKEICMKEFEQIGHLACSLPWSVYEYERLKRAMGEDYWSYGLEVNRHVIETLAGYSFDQGLSARKVSAEELFARSTQELSKI
ncbi:MAG TPA: ABC transporter substrate-binding protein [Xanthobacteraceae bacterium]|nr:ABC transporter substrate-binding protein [Xanthobacteraceae bacterium]